MSDSYGTLSSLRTNDYILFNKECNANTATWEDIDVIRDAYSEMMADIRTYRLWLVLEYITYIFNYDDKLSEKDRVDKLIKEETPDYYNEPSCYGLKTEDFLDICLQRRNCCAHQGGCIAGSDGKCSTNLTKSKERREKCRPHPVQDTHFVNDGICRELEWLGKRKKESCIYCLRVGNLMDEGEY